VKTTRLYYLGLSGLALVCVACGASKPSPELVTARNMYTQARNGEAAQLNPTGVHDAYKSLQAAEAAHEDDAGSSKERHRAYIATRKSELAIAQASEALAMKEQERAEQTYKQTLEQQSNQLAQQNVQQSSEYQQQLQQNQQQLQQNQEQLQQAQAEAQRAQDELRKLESFREEAGRTIISLPGVLFEVGKAELAPMAARRLDTVVAALKAYPDKEIVIEGFTDAQGSETTNLALSQQRANAVRGYLESRGIPGDRLRAEGRGESSPIASNDTPEGRAYNRRVEIVVDQATASQPASDQSRQNVSGTDDEASPAPRQQQRQKSQQPSQGQQPSQAQPQQPE